MSIFNSTHFRNFCDMITEDRINSGKSGKIDLAERITVMPKRMDNDNKIQIDVTFSVRYVSNMPTVYAICDLHLKETTPDIDTANEKCDQPLVPQYSFMLQLNIRPSKGYHDKVVLLEVNHAELNGNDYEFLVNSLYDAFGDMENEHLLS